VAAVITALSLHAATAWQDVAFYKTRPYIARLGYIVLLLAPALGLIARNPRWALDAPFDVELKPIIPTPPVFSVGPLRSSLHDGRSEVTSLSSRRVERRARAVNRRSSTAILDLDAFDRTPLETDPCEFVHVERFVRPELFEAVAAEFPPLDEPGSFDADEQRCGPLFRTLLEELHGSAVADAFTKKFGVDLAGIPRQIGVRRYAAPSDGRIHNDSRNKFVTAIIYFNRSWDTNDGCLRILRDPPNLEDYALQIQPIQGNLIAFRRSERSYHGFRTFSGERLSLQMYWVNLNRLRHGGPKHSWAFVREIKRLFKTG